MTSMLTTSSERESLRRSHKTAALIELRKRCDRLKAVTWLLLAPGQAAVNKVPG
jgi:hypothetical protein